MKKYIPFILLILLLSNITKSQWVQSNGPFSISAKCFAEIGDNLIVGTSGQGVFITTNKGLNWVSISNGLSGNALFVNAIGVENTNIVIGTGNGVFITTNNGNNWTSINNGISGSIISLLISGTNIFAGKSNGVFLSTNYGVNWTSVNNGLTNLYVNVLCQIGETVFVGTGGGGVYKSTNNGTNWTAINNGLTGNALYISAFTAYNSNCYIGTSDGVYYSSIGTYNWTPKNNGLTNELVLSFEVNNNKIYAATKKESSIGNIYTIYGINWIPINEGMYYFPSSVNDILFFKGDMYAGTTPTGVFKSTNNGTFWLQFNTGLIGYNENILDLSSNGSVLFAGSYAGGIYSSINNGSDWIEANEGLTSPYVNCLAVAENNNIFAGTDTNGIFLSTNNGKSWNSVNNGLTNLKIESIYTFGSYIFAGTSGGGVFLSTNNGASWVAKNNGLSGNSLYVLSFMKMGSQIFIGTYSGVFKSLNNGATWVAANTGISTYSVYSLASLDSKVYAGTNSNGLFVSTNNGNSWINKNNGLTNLSIKALIFSKYYFFAGTGGGGVFLSKDKGESWSNITQGNSLISNVHSLLLANNKLFAGTSNNIWNYNLTFEYSEQLLDYGTIQTNTLKEKSVNIFAYDTITIQNITSLDTNFKTLTDSIFTLFPSSYKEIKIGFTPADSNVHNSKLMIKYIKNSVIYYDSSVLLIGKGKNLISSSFSLLSPSNFSTDVAVYRSFQWVDAFSGQPGTYRLRYGTDPSFSSGTYTEINDIMGTEWYPEEDLTLNNIYYWMVYAKNSDGTFRAANEIFQYQTILNTPLVFGKTYGNRKLRKSNSPYIMNSDFTVDTNHIFTIPEGTEIKVNDNFEIVIKGVMKSLGTSTDSVKIYSNTNELIAGKWKGIRFVSPAKDLVLDSSNNVVSGSEFKYTVIKNTGYENSPSINSLIDYNYGNIKISNCTFYLNNCANYVVKTANLNSIIGNSTFFANSSGLYGGRHITNCLINNNNNNGVESPNCVLFVNNRILNNNGYGCKIGDNSLDSIKIIGNIINANYGLTGYGLYTGSKAIIEFNTIKDNSGYGIQGGSIFRNDTLINNKVFAITTTNGSIFENLFVYNNKGFGISNSSNFLSNYYNCVVNNNDTISGNNFGIYNLGNSKFNNNTINNNGGYGILAPLGTEFRNNTVIGNFGYGVNIGTSLNINILIESNFIKNNNGQNTSDKYGIKSNSQAVFKNNVISYNQTAGVDGGKSFTNDSVYYNSGNGLQTQSNTDVSLTNYFSQGNGLSGVYIYGNPASITVLNCLFKQDVGQGLSISNTNALYVHNTIVIGDTINNTASNPPDFTGEMGMSVQNSRNINIYNSTFKNWWAGGLSFFNTKQISIVNDSIINNKWIGIYVTGGDTVNIDSSEVMYNGSIANNDKGGGIYLNIDHARLTTSFLNFNKSKNGGGLYINSFSPFIYNSTFYSNQCSTNGGAIFTGGTTTTNPTIVYNTIVNNSSAINTGGGIYILKTNSNRTKISRNIISENLGHGIYGDPDTLIQNNLTYNKFFNGSAGYALRKANNVNLDATYNWWGTRSDQVAVENMIYHKQDSSSLGLVSFQPFLGSPSIQAPGQITQATSLGLFTDTTYSTQYLGMIMIGQKAFMQLGAVDANPFSRDVTPIRIKNLRTNQSIEALAVETGISTGIFRDTAKVMTSTNFNLNQIGGANGDTILFYSTVTPAVEKRLVVTSILAPQLVSPLNYAVGVFVNPSFVWRKVIGATSYRLQIATDSLFGNIVTNDSLILDSTKTVTGLSPSTYYYWRVNSVNNFGNGSFSEFRSFRTINNPSTVVQSYPANGATSLSTTLTFKWFKSTDIIDGRNNEKKFEDQRNINDNDILSPDFITNYWFEYSTDSSFTVITGRDTLLTDTLKTVTGLDNFTKYYWRVKAKNEIGWGSFSDKWNFTTVLSAPLLTLPANNSTGVSLTPLLTWGVVTGASSYRIQVSTDSLFTNTQWDTTGVTAVTANVPAGKLTGLTKYYWRVNGTNTGGTGAWSTVWNFKTLQSLSLNLKVYLEGFWNGMSQVSDSVTVYLANPTIPFAFMDSAKVILSTTGAVLVNFSKAPNGNYFIVVNHRNHLETWSKLAQSFVTNAAVNYDFTTAANKAFGDNMKQVGSVWVLYGGDGNRDGSIDALDVFAFIGQFGNSGYLSCDFNGDESVDALDVPIIIANFGLGKSVPTLDVQIGGNIRKERVIDEIQKLFKLNGESQKKETLKNKK